MSTQVTLSLSDEVYRRAEQLAQNSGQDVTKLLAEKLEISITAESTNAQSVIPVVSLSDGDVLSLSYLQMDKEQDQRLSDLLYKQQAGELSDSERLELGRLMQIYSDGLLRKSEALAEAVRRGLRETPAP